MRSKTELEVRCLQNDSGDFELIYYLNKIHKSTGNYEIVCKESINGKTVMSSVRNLDFDRHNAYVWMLRLAEDEISALHMKSILIEAVE